MMLSLCKLVITNEENEGREPEEGEGIRSRRRKEQGEEKAK